MKVSLIICTYSIELFQDTLECINSLISQDYEKKEIILVMDVNHELYNMLHNSIPESVNICINSHKGLSEARNLGIKEASGEIIVFIDDDAIADINYLSNLLKNYDKKGVVGVVGKVLPKQIPDYPEELYWIVGFTYKGFPESKCEVRNVHGCNMSFKKDVFEVAGLFDTRFGRVGKKLITAEETEFSIRVLNSFPGSKIIYDPSVIVYHKSHKYRQTLSYILRRGYHEGMSKARIENIPTNKKINKLLSAEESYLKYLLFISVPARLRNIFTFKDIRLSIKEVIQLLLVIISVGIGYLMGRMKSNKLNFGDNKVF